MILVRLHHGGGAGGWLVLVGGTEVVLLSSAGLLPVEAVQKRRGAVYCHGHVCAAGMVLSRAKAFTDVLSVGMVAAPFGHRFPCWGHHGEAPCSPQRGALRVKTLSIYGCATAAPWRRALVGGAASGDPEWLVVVGVVVSPVRCWMCARFVLAERCRGPMGAGGLELASKVQW